MTRLRFTICQLVSRAIRGLSEPANGPGNEVGVCARVQSDDERLASRLASMYDARILICSVDRNESTMIRDQVAESAYSNSVRFLFRPDAVFDSEYLL